MERSRFSRRVECLNALLLFSGQQRLLSTGSKGFLTNEFPIWPTADKKAIALILAKSMVQGKDLAIRVKAGRALYYAVKDVEKNRKAVRSVRLFVARALKDKEVKVRYRALQYFELLLNEKDGDILEEIVSMVNHPSVETQIDALRTLRMISFGGKNKGLLKILRRGIPSFLKHLTGPKEDLRIHAIAVLSKMGSDAVVLSLRKRLREETSSQVRGHLAIELALLGDKKALSVLQALAKKYPKDKDIRWAIRKLSKL